MFNNAIVDIHGGANISGLVYGPSFIEIENKEGSLQYFNGAILGGGGVLLQGDSGSGDIIVKFDASTINRLATDDAKGQGLRVIAEALDVVDPVEESDCLGVVSVRVYVIRKLEKIIRHPWKDVAAVLIPERFPH